jgi:ureidoglycolate lyase
MDVQAMNLLDADFSPFGRVYQMTQDDPSAAPTTSLIRSSGPGWSDAYTSAPLLSTNGSLGFTRGSASPFVTSRMERHLLSEEALFCAADPIVLAVAAPTIGDRPSAASIQAFVITPGTVVVLNKGTWHDACHGIDKEAYYYWMATCGTGGTSPWVEVDGGPVRVVASSPAEEDLNG